MRTPLRVTFDTNTYSVVARPHIRRLFVKFWPVSKSWLKSACDRVCWWYLNWCIRRGRIIAGIPEATLKAEVLPNVDRVTLLLAVGTLAAASPPAIPAIRMQIIQAAFETGFRVLRSPRIGWGATYQVPPEYWMPDNVTTQADRLSRESAFIRHFGNYALEHVKDYGEQLSRAHGLAALPENSFTAAMAQYSALPPDRRLWREGLEAEEGRPVVEASVMAFQRKLRSLLADWVDVDVVAVHYAYGFDVLCSQERGTSPSSIFSPTRAPALNGTFGVIVMNVRQLSALCLRRFGFPIRKSS